MSLYCSLSLRLASLQVLPLPGPVGRWFVEVRSPRPAFISNCSSVTWCGHTITKQTEPACLPFDGTVGPLDCSSFTCRSWNCAIWVLLSKWAWYCCHSASSLCFLKYLSLYIIDIDYIWVNNFSSFIVCAILLMYCKYFFLQPPFWKDGPSFKLLFLLPCHTLVPLDGDSFISESGRSQCV